MPSRQLTVLCQQAREHGDLPGYTASIITANTFTYIEGQTARCATSVSLTAQPGNTSLVVSS